MDMKGGVVAGLAALRALVDTEAELDGEAVLVTVPAEEDGGAGMLAAIRAGYVAEMAVITEPTRLQIVTAQAGAMTFRLTVSGRSAHAAYRLQGVSAFEKLRVIHDALLADEHERNAAEQDPAMRALGLPYPTNLGMIAGGDWSSTVPDRLVVEGRYGVARRDDGARPSWRCATRWRRPAPATSGCATIRPTVEITGGRFASAAVPHTHPLPWSLGETARDVLGKLPDFVGVPYGADMRLLVNEGATPTVLYGPGDPFLAHAPGRARRAGGRGPLRAGAGGVDDAGAGAGLIRPRAGRPEPAARSPAPPRPRTERRGPARRGRWAARPAAPPPYPRT